MFKCSTKMVRLHIENLAYPYLRNVAFYISAAFHGVYSHSSGGWLLNTSRWKLRCAPAKYPRANFIGYPLVVLNMQKLPVFTCCAKKWTFFVWNLCPSPEISWWRPWYGDNWADVPADKYVIYLGWSVVIRSIVSYNEADHCLWIDPCISTRLCKSYPYGW